MRPTTDGFAQKTRTDRGFFCAPLLSLLAWQPAIGPRRHRWPGEDFPSALTNAAATFDHPFHPARPMNSAMRSVYR